MWSKGISVGTVQGVRAAGEKVISKEGVINRGVTMHREAVWADQVGGVIGGMGSCGSGLFNFFKPLGTSGEAVAAASALLKVG